MEIEERVAKVEAETEMLKESQKALREAVERGFAEQRLATVQGFAEMRASQAQAIAELRKEMRWVAGLLVTNTVFIIGIVVRLGGVF